MKKSILSVLALLAVAVTVWAAYPYYIHTWTGVGSRRNTTEFSISAASAGAAAIFAPGTTNTNALGSSSLRFSNVYTQLLNVAGASTFNGNIGLTGDLTASGTIQAARANIGVQLSTAPLTSTTLVYLSTGTLVFNTTDSQLCVSTSSNQNSFVLTTDLTTACSH